jgi:hypothetical protein
MSRTFQVRTLTALWLSFAASLAVAAAEPQNKCRLEAGGPRKGVRLLAHCALKHVPDIAFPHNK